MNALTATLTAVVLAILTLLGIACTQATHAGTQRCGSSSIAQCGGAIGDGRIG